MALPPTRVLALCAGGGGLELGIKLAVPGARLVGAVEREAFAAACLVARMEDASLEAAPIWDDLATFDGRPWRGAVDLVAGGFPCQPVSSAGRRLGDADVRWLWPEVRRVVDEVGPSLVFLENVPDLATWGRGRLLGGVLGDLADLGFDAEWSLLSAAAVGATQLRKRFFLVAYRHDSRLSIERSLLVPDDGLTPRWDDPDGPCGPLVEVAHGRRRTQRPGHPHHEGRSVEPEDASGALAGTPGEGRESVALTGDCRATSGGGTPELGRRRVDRCFPPGPDELDAWARTEGPQPSVRRVADGMAHRLDRIHAIGNGVVPLVAAAALIGLASRARILEVV